MILYTVYSLYTLCFDQLYISAFKSRRYISEENQTYYYLSVLSRRYMSPKDTSRIPNLFFKSNVCLSFISHFVTSTLYSLLKLTISPILQSRYSHILKSTVIATGSPLPILAIVLGLIFNAASISFLCIFLSIRSFHNPL